MRTIDIIRQLATAGNISYTIYATRQMISRSISVDTVAEILCAADNQIVEIQSPSSTPGKEHKNPRYLVYSPRREDVVVVSLIIKAPLPEVRVVTAEYVDDFVWERKQGENPAIVRKAIKEKK